MRANRSRRRCPTRARRSYLIYLREREKKRGLFFVSLCVVAAVALVFFCVLIVDFRFCFVFVFFFLSISCFFLSLSLSLAQNCLGECKLAQQI